MTKAPSKNSLLNVQNVLPIIPNFLIFYSLYYGVLSSVVTKRRCSVTALPDLCLRPDGKYLIFIHIM